MTWVSAQVIVHFPGSSLSSSIDPRRPRLTVVRRSLGHAGDTTASPENSGSPWVESGSLLGVDAPVESAELERLVGAASSSSWEERAASGRQLALLAGNHEVDLVLGRLLLDPQDTALTRRTRR
jgi:hypothetical protein